MTLDTLRLTVANLKQLASAIKIADDKLQNLINDVEVVISPNNRFIDVFFPNEAAVDAFVAIESQAYINILTELETATDSLGTDILH